MSDLFCARTGLRLCEGIDGRWRQAHHQSAVGSELHQDLYPHIIQPDFSFEAIHENVVILTPQFLWKPSMKTPKTSLSIPQIK